MVITLSRIIVLGLAFATTVFFSLVLFALLGILIGGNFFESFEAFGLRGYEATGQLGVIIGAIFGSVAGFFVVKRLAKTTFPLPKRTHP
jgi:hypothetical protein